MDSRELLQQYVTNVDDDVFAIKNLHGMVGAVMARYSRAEGSLRDTLLREFVKENQLNPRKASKLIQRVLIAYGDDSVGELEGAHLSFENISMLATKVIEHRRIGGSPIEQSTRYIRYDFKDEATGYHYHQPEHITGEDGATYRRLMDGIFANYSDMWQPLEAWLIQCKPIESATYDLGEMGQTYSEMASPKAKAAFERTWRADIKTKTCDILRAFLPLAAKANVGLFGNGRFFQHLISKMLSSHLPEAQKFGGKALKELTEVIPHYVKRAKPMGYLIRNRQNMDALASKYFGDLDLGKDDGIGLIEPDNAFLAETLSAGPVTADAIGSATRAEQNLNFLASLVFAHTRASFTAIRDRIKAMPPEGQQEIMDAYYGERQTRRDRPERGIEFGYPYSFDLVTEWAVYKDLMRHRMGTIMIQPMAPDLGFTMPEELRPAGLAEIARHTVAYAEELYQFLAEKYPDEREYAMLQGHRVRWFLGMNDRALMHMVELRSAPQGHLNYRRAAQELHRLAISRFPERAKRMSFVNYDDSYWARSDSEAKQRVRESQLDEQN